VFSHALPRRRLVEVCQPGARLLRRVAGAPVDLNRRTNRPQLQFVADANATSFGERLGERDLEFSGYSGHDRSWHRIKDVVKEKSLTEASRKTMEE
jgi:hypothetical protein